MEDLPHARRVLIRLRKSLDLQRLLQRLRAAEGDLDGACRSSSAARPPARLARPTTARDVNTCHCCDDPVTGECCFAEAVKAPSSISDVPWSTRDTRQPWLGYIFHLLVPGCRIFVVSLNLEESLSYLNRTSRTRIRLLQYGENQPRFITA